MAAIPNPRHLLGQRRAITWMGSAQTTTIPRRRPRGIGQMSRMVLINLG